VQPDHTPTNEKAARPGKGERPMDFLAATDRLAGRITMKGKHDDGSTFTRVES